MFRKILGLTVLSLALILPLALVQAQTAVVFLRILITH